MEQSLNPRLVTRPRKLERAGAEKRESEGGMETERGRERGGESSTLQI